MYAADNGHTAIVEVLVEAGADTEAKNKIGWTALVCGFLIAILLILVNAGGLDIEAQISLNRRRSKQGLTRRPRTRISSRQ